MWNAGEVSTDAVSLRLVVEPGEPLAGSVAADGQPPTAFAGWVELMALISAARDQDAEDRR